MPEKKTAAKKAAPEHPKYSVMIADAITSLKDRKGSSRQAIEKFINANYKVGSTSSVHLKMALKRGVAAETLVQVKGQGASGSFKLPKAAAAPKKAVAKAPAVKKVVKKPAAKKVTKKVTKKASPKKVAKKVTKKASPKKATKKVVKKPAAKKTKAKK